MLICEMQSFDSSNKSHSEVVDVDVVVVCARQVAIAAGKKQTDYGSGIFVLEL